MLANIVIRHRKENLKKCSLRGLETRSDFCFLTYPMITFPKLHNYFLLSFDGPPLSKKDRDLGFVLLDGTWRYAEKMEANLTFLSTLPKRSLPKEIQTAYPRKQEDCPYPSQGLASIEAIFVAHLLQGRKTDGLLDHYYWKERFLAHLSLIGYL